ncbi:MAG: phytanoyl-CoA dioxygenase family protein, partial [Thiovulaceae bacterium]|nr:phytanoyl-CoA dioxygenase family protein [Sulfurimonadaceae bacterium]
MQLTTEQINDFHTNGFLLLPQFADHQRCDAILELAAHHLFEQIEPIESEEEYLQKSTDSKTTRRLRQVYDREPLFAQWMTESEIRPVLKQLLGDEPCLL